MPLYDIDAPEIFKFAGLGSQIASAIATVVLDSWDLWDNDTWAKLLTRAACFFGKPMAAGDFIEEHWDLLIRVAALRVLWTTVQSAIGNNATVVLRGLQHLTEWQLFFVAWCFMYCGEPNGHDHCNRPLRYVSAFAEVFRCSPYSAMTAPHECPLF
ncbi:unnamed protein product [Ixodes hexagonus]